MKHTLLLVSLLWTGQVFASVNLISIHGASNIIDDNGVYSIYGGFVGRDCAVKDGVNTCDNCAGASFNNQDLVNGGCNSARAYPELQVQFEVSSDIASGIPVLLNPQGVSVGVNSGRTAKRAVGTITISWGELCAAMGSSTGGVGAATCMAASGALSATGWKVGVDTTGTGQLTESVALNFYAVSSIASPTGFFSETCANSTPTDGACDFSLEPGNAKAWISTLQAPAAFPSAIGTIQFDLVRFYYTQGDWSQLNPSSPHQDIAIGGSSSTGDLHLVESSIKGLQNQTNSAPGNYYYFMMASVDQAGNVGFFTNPNDPAFQTDDHRVLPHK